jgi:DNA-binding NtrC family response regulator
MEKLMIMDRLAQLNQNRTRSAESLDISVRTLRNKLRDYRSQVSLVGVDSESS